MDKLIEVLSNSGVPTIAIILGIAIGYFLQKKLDTRNENTMSRFKNDLEIVKAQQLSILNFNSQVASTLWNKRYESYLFFWKLSVFLPQYPKNTSITYSELLQKSEAMRDWYFENGGILLSENTKQAYFNLQEEMLKIIYSQTTEPISTNKSPIKMEEYDTIRKQFSIVRTNMTEDLDSRQNVK